MEFCWTTIHVLNMEESLAFYQEIVGLTLNRRFTAPPALEFAFLGAGETQVELIHEKGEKPSTFGPGISLGFQTDSLDTVMAALRERGIPLLAGPIQPNPSLRFIFVADPNGLQIQFVEVAG